MTEKETGNAQPGACVVVLPLFSAAYGNHGNGHSREVWVPLKRSVGVCVDDIIQQIYSNEHSWQLSVPKFDEERESLGCISILQYDRIIC